MYRIGKKLAAVVCFLLVLGLLAACTAAGGEPTEGTQEPQNTTPTVLPTQATEPVTQPVETEPVETAPPETEPEVDTMNVADFLEVVIPEGYQDALIVEEVGYAGDMSTILYAFREKASVEQWIADYGEDDGNAGKLYTISVQTQEQLDQYQSPGAEKHYFAKDEEKGLYYIYGPGGGFTAYRSDGIYDESFQEVWGALLEIQYTTLAQSIIEANGLVPYTDTDFEAVYGPLP